MGAEYEENIGRDGLGGALGMKMSYQIKKRHKVRGERWEYTGEVEGRKGSGGVYHHILLHICMKFSKKI